MGDEIGKHALGARWSCSRPDMASFDALTGEQVTFIYLPDGSRLPIGGGGDVAEQVRAVVAAHNTALIRKPRRGSQTERALTAILKAGKPLTNRELTGVLDDIGPYVARTMAKLRERGLVKNVGSSHFALYALTDPGRAALQHPESGE